jgi:hypothetical protein
MLTNVRAAIIPGHAIKIDIRKDDDGAVRVEIRLRGQDFPCHRGGSI